MSGLDRVQKGPLGLFADARASLSVAPGLLPSMAVVGELGWKPRENVSVFGDVMAQGTLGGPLSVSAGVGVRMLF